MARKVIIEDDLSGEPGAEERNFAIGDKVYEIDLTDGSWNWLQDILEPVVEVARQVATINTTANGVQDIRKLGASTRRMPADPEERHSREDLDACRSWCNANGVKLPAGGGKIAAVVWQAWALKDVSIVPEKFMLGEGEENSSVALAAQRRQENGQQAFEG